MRRQQLLQSGYLFLAACLCLPLVGCGGDAATTDAPATPAASDAGSDDGSDDGSATSDDAGSEAKEEAAAE